MNDNAMERNQCLQRELVKEKELNQSLTLELEKLRLLLARNSLETEVEEDFITNKLNKKLQEAVKQKEVLILERDQNEEKISNILHKKMYLMHREKAKLLSEQELEQESIVNKLNRQLSRLKTDIDELKEKYQEKINNYLNIIFDIIPEDYSNDINCIYFKEEKVKDYYKTLISLSKELQNQRKITFSNN